MEIDWRGLLEVVGPTASIIGLLGGFFAWLFKQFQKNWLSRFAMLELRFSGLEKDIHSLAEDSRDQRKRTDQLYEILINVMKEKKI